ncbi:response regulator [Clostridium sp. cel8]|jgi:DNA-binding response OmpR family regulator|uniref:response regulator n=1 Tax=Clostridium sp. cel8 TaxID=2663123 RepID=UPI0015F4FA1A|nr:response regulator [Clostridium sp. cel8]MBA5851014.1 response regulator [Clostridium sp. cel8]
MNKVIILDDMAYMRYRVKDTIEDMGLEVCESSNSFDFFNKLSDNMNDIVLIILEVGLSNEDGFEILKKVKAKEFNIPVMVLTKLNTRDAFIKCIKEGTSEYILKPFNTKMFIERVKKLIKLYKDENISGEIKYLNFEEYINKQIEKSRQKNTELSIIMSSIIKVNAKKTDEKIEVNDSYLVFLDVVYENIKKIFKVPDLFEKYGISAFISVIPNCSENLSKYKISQMNHIYNSVRNEDSKHTEYELVSSSVTFPKDGFNKSELLDKLALKMKRKINA